jgi:taurine dioxygenase
MGIENINFRALSPFGIEASEISITQINDEDLVLLRYVIANNCFIVFRKQSVSDAEFVAFLN